MIRRTAISLIFVALCWRTILFSQADEGYAGAFLRMGLGARARSMSDAFVAVANDGYALFYNPAGFPFLESREVTASYRILSFDRTFNYIGYAGKVGPTGGVAFGWIHAGVDGIDERDFSGNVTGEITDSENGFYFSFANRIYKELSIGVSGKILYHKLYSISAKGFGIDFGVLYRGRENFSFGFQIKDIHSRFSWNSDEIYERGTTSTDLFPLEFKIGSSWYYSAQKIQVSLQFDKNDKSNWKVRIGTEKRIFDFFIIRAGFNGDSITGGMGLLVECSGKRAVIDYATCKENYDIQYSHIFSFSVLF